MANNRSCRRKTSLPIREKGEKCALSDLIEETGHRAEIQDPVFKQNPAGTSRNRRDFGVKKVG